MAGIRVGNFLFLKYFQDATAILKLGEVDGGEKMLDVQGLSDKDMFSEI